MWPRSPTARSQPVLADTGCPAPMHDLIQAYERQLGRWTVRAGSGCLLPLLGLVAATVSLKVMYHSRRPPNRHE